MFGLYYGSVANSGALALPTVASISVTSMNQGVTYTAVDIVGTNFTGATVVSLGAGVTVGSFTVINPTLITIDSLTVEITATLGTRDVSVTTPSGTGTLPAAVTILFGFGNALQFDGANDFVSHNAYTLGGSGTAFSFSGWFKYNSTAVVNGKNIIGNSGSTNFFIDSLTTTTIRVRLGTVYTYTIPTTTTNWFHLVVSKDTSNNMRLYINGVESSTGAIGVGANLLSAIDRVGARAATVTDAMRVDQVAVWNNYALSPAEITTLYNSGNGNAISSVGGTPILVYEMNEVSGASTATNTGSGSFTGTLNNFNTATCWVAH